MGDVLAGGLRMRRVRLITGVTLTVLACAAVASAFASGSHPGTQSQASWLMEQEPRPGGVVVDSTASNDGGLADNTTIVKAGPLNPYAGTSSYYFNGWDDGLPGQVDATASSIVVPNADALNPDTSDFEVSFWMAPRNPKDNPAIGNCEAQPTSQCHADLNIIQKGMGNTDQWKVSLRADGAIICVFKDASTGSQVRVSDHADTVPAHNYVGPVFVSCALAHDGGPSGTRGYARLVVGHTVDPIHSSAAHPMKCYSSVNRSDEPNPALAMLPAGSTVAPTGDLWIGKKPQVQPLRTDDWDTYAGSLDDVQVFKGLSSGPGSHCA